MSFLGERSGAQKLGGVLLVIGIVVAIRILWTVGAFDSLVGRNTPEAIEARIEQEITANPAFAGMYQAMEREFPEDYEMLKEEMVIAYQQRGEVVDGVLAGRAFMDGFNRRNGMYFTSAPDAAINAVRDASITAVNILAAEDTALCAHFAMTGLRLGDEPSLEAQEVLGSLAEESIVALAAGRADPVARADINGDDIDAYAAMLAIRGLRSDLIEDFLGGARVLLRESEDVQCQAGIAIYGAMSDLSDEQSARIGSVLLSRAT